MEKWPEKYPDRLKPISWCIDGRCAGPHRYFNRHLPYHKRGDSAFMKQTLMDAFTKSGMKPSQAMDCMAQHLVDGFTVMMEMRWRML
jgi:hypothetical protein